MRLSKTVFGDLLQQRRRPACGDPEGGTGGPDPPPPPEKPHKIEFLTNTGTDPL